MVVNTLSGSYWSVWIRPRGAGRRGGLGTGVGWKWEYSPAPPLQMIQLTRLCVSVCVLRVFVCLCNWFECWNLKSLLSQTGGGEEKPERHQPPERFPLTVVLWMFLQKATHTASPRRAWKSFYYNSTHSNLKGKRGTSTNPKPSQLNTPEQMNHDTKPAIK